MSLLTLKNIHHSYGLQPLFDGIDLTIQPGERICLMGRNGVGKSTLLEVIAANLEPDSGEVMRSQGVVVSALAQEVPQNIDGTVLDLICAMCGPAGQRLVDYRRLCARSDAATAPDEGVQQGINDLQQVIDAENGWQIEQNARRILTRMNLPTDGAVNTFSAGKKRQVMLAAALTVQPDLLLLDEPTNHLDMDAIDWLESFLLKWGGTLLMITHDRMLMRKLATRIVEVDRGQLHSWACDYDTYLKRNLERLASEAQENRRFDKKLSAEEVWIRQGIKARRTRNEGRVRALQKLREERRQRRDRTGQVRMRLDSGRQSGKIVAEAKNLTFAYEGRTIVDDLSCTIMRGDRIGILGPNGVGKTTLVRLLLGELTPASGSIRHGTHLEVLYFDQLRGQLDEAKTVQQNVCPDGDMVESGGRRRHVIGYLGDFLFSPQRARTPVHVLSGGEKNRLLLAKLFTRSANVIVLDEPTNDLDVETLELLEELLLDYKGTVLLVSHDRAFVNNAVTSTLVFEQPGRVKAYAGGYDDWLVQRPQPSSPAPEKQLAPRPKKKPPSEQAKPKKLGYMEGRELEALPGRIEALETRQQELFDAMADADFFKQAKDRIAAVQAELERVEADLEEAFARWEALEARQQQ